MLVTMGLGLTALAAYIVFDRLYPERKKIRAKAPEFETNITYKDCVIYGNPKSYKSGKHQCYKFICRVNPDRARLSDGTVLGMTVPDEFIIRMFVVGVDPMDNSVDYVYLGPEQYHCDLDLASECICLQHLHKEILNYDFLEKLLDLLMIYDIDDPMRADHWDDKNFSKMNNKLKLEMA
jgi:hypothetical protein